MLQTICCALLHEFWGRGLLWVAADALTVLDQQSPQLFDRFEQILSRTARPVLDQGLRPASGRPDAEDYPLMVRRTSNDFSQANVLVVRLPERLGLVCGHE